MRSVARTCRFAAITLLSCVFGLVALATAHELTLDDGRVLSGVWNEVASVAEDPQHPKTTVGGVAVKPIVVVFDGLKRTFIPQNRVKQVTPTEDNNDFGIDIPQNVDRNGVRILLGEVRSITPFDEHGRRIYSMQRPDGSTAHVVQGITKITPHYTIVESLEQRDRSAGNYKWEMRLATSSIPRDTLRAILAHYLDFNTPDDRLELVRLYLRGGRFEDARRELDAVIQDYPDLADLKVELRNLRQLSARQVLREIELRHDAGQFGLVQRLLANFPTEDIAGETQQQVRALLSEFQGQAEQAQLLLGQLDQLVREIKDPGLAARTAPIVQEIKQEMGAHGYTLLPRLTAFGRLASDETLDPEHRVSLALSGWIEGSNNANENLAVAISLYEVRRLVREYLMTWPDENDRRRQILTELESLEGGNPDDVAKILALMTPPLAVPPNSQVDEQPGYFRIPLEGGDGRFSYYVQLPPEYDPHRRYPTVVVLNGLGVSPQLQLDWWAGPQSENGRLGQATRRGYIVVSVDWQPGNLPHYGFTAAEHYAVLASLRDAMRRFSIDSDKVFLSGHDIGGDAAWDIALAHPDLWAGAIPIVAVGSKYVTRYRKNAQYVPFYFVCGELDGTKMADNAIHLDRYLTDPRDGLPSGFDATVVEYVGRGHEHFSDSIQDIFDWMAVRRRNFSPKNFAVDTMRPWDNFFWWVELNEVPSRFVVDPIDWPQKSVRPLTLEARVNAQGSLRINPGGAPLTLWLSPDLVDFQQRFSVDIVRRGTVRDFAERSRPDLAVLLEDARTRADRQHPFWARVVIE